VNDFPGSALTLPHTSRVVNLDQMFNVRDLGGLPTLDGRQVRPGLLFRADDPHLATDADAAALAALGIASVIDLRTPSEVEQRGIRRWDELGVRRYALPLWREVPGTDHGFKYHDPRLTAELYAVMHEDNLESHPRLWNALAEATAQGPTVIHCASGRDRTGILVALLLSLLGVEVDRIVEDYAMSATGMTRMLAHLEAIHSADALASVNLDKEAMVLTPPEAMAHFLDRVRTHHGGMEGYAAAIGITETAPVLREQLLVA
jgi:protein tyrosine/serine phosphatase